MVVSGRAASWAGGRTAKVVPRSRTAKGPSRDAHIPAIGSGMQQNVYIDGASVDPRTQMDKQLHVISKQSMQGLVQTAPRHKYAKYARSGTNSSTS